MFNKILTIYNIMLEFGLYLSKYNESDDIVHLSLGVKLLGKYNEVEKSYSCWLE